MDVNIFEDPMAAPADAAPAKKRASYDSLRMDGPGGEPAVGQIAFLFFFMIIFALASIILAMKHRSS